MDIDLHALPVPDWGLTCPVCRYALAGLPAHRCPECGHAFDVAALVKTWTRLREPWFSGTERPIPVWGLHCRGCGLALEGMRGDNCEGCGRSLARELARPRGEWFVLEKKHHAGLLMHTVLALMEDAAIPHYQSQEQTLWQIYLGSSPLDQRIRVRSEFLFDLLYVVEQERRRLAEETQEHGGSSWRCADCQEENPANFAICWSCGAAL